MRCSRALVAGLLLAPLSAQSLAWLQQTQAFAPPARAWASMVYNATTQRCMMFGGMDPGGNVLGATWVWNGISWIDITPAVSPPARFHAGMAYDSVAMRVILFGGQSASGTPTNDTWAWNGTNWTQLTPANPPPALIGMNLAYDPLRQVIVGFGGVDPAAGVGGGSTARTYEFDGTDWQEVVPLQFPPHRWRAHLFFNEVRGRIQVYGGVKWFLSIPRGDLWEWDGATWTDLTPAASPEAVDGSSAAYDKSLQRLVRIGGKRLFSSVLDEQWFWGGFWRDGSGTIRPPAGMGAAMAFDEARQRLVKFGRAVSTGQETWLSDLVYSASSAAYGNSCAATLQLASDRPVIGTTVNIQMFSPPSIFAFLAAGWSNASFNGQPLPIDLTALGMTGCELLTSSEVVGFAMSPGATTASYGVSLPNVPALIGIQMFLQGYALDPFASALPLVTTNGIEWLIGDF